MGAMGLESIRRGMKAEDDLAKRHADANHNLLYGKQDTISSGEDDDMGNIYLGDVTTTYTKPNSGLGFLAKAAITAGLLGGGAGLGLGLSSLIPNDTANKPNPSTVVEPGEVRDWELGQPVVE